ncbi:dipeptide transport ATP-binding protein DppD [Treponema primitia ZAS-2]|uniref:Dipeptide transport ATP-binding protein DppD n=2 Tax=Treponema primitia TaxID=88058 RepID=F5YLG0_TREPZ|nr:dipeptide transport ATP-binding protein DppD [Treponema primitia ZAS-2]
MDEENLKDKDLISVEDLSVLFRTKYGSAKIINNISFKLKPGERLGIVGESGSGKSITARAIMGILPNLDKEVKGRIVFQGRNLLELGEKEMRDLRGNRMAMIFQEPMISLDPLFSIENQLIEALNAHKKTSATEARKKILDLLTITGIKQPEIRMKQYPFEFSGGMRQRVMIAMALLCNPELLVADEPTTALDVTIQAQIMDLLHKINKEFGTAIILITHDLGLVYEQVDQVAVMYAGSLVEKGPVEKIFSNPLHPYTRGLFNAMPSIEEKREKLETIEGNVPSLYELPPGCAFAPRCGKARDFCHSKIPPIKNIGSQEVQCWLYANQEHAP